MSISDGSNRYYYVLNQQGDVIGLLNSNEELIVMYVYDAWGRVLASADLTASGIGINNPLRYRGYVYDTETGLYYLQSRYYNPTWGRFINADDPGYMGVDGTPSSYNLFSYCGNNPVTRADDDGEFWHIIVGGIFGAAFGGVAKIITNWIDGKPWNHELGTAMAAGALGGMLGASGAGLLTTVIGNATISMGENAINQIVANEGLSGFNVGDMLFNGFVGGVAGRLGGAGKGSKHLTKLGAKTISRPATAWSHKGISYAMKEVKRAFSYYAKNAKTYYKKVLSDLPQDFMLSLGSSFATSDYMKSQYSCLWG